MTVGVENSAEVSGAGRGAAGWRARAWRYGPLVLWVGVVLFASTGTFSASNTSRILRPLLLWLFPDISDDSLLAAHFFARKAAHFAEYFVLALFAARAFLSSTKGVLRARWHAAAFALAASVALLDEYLQSFNPARTGTMYDSLLDMSGGAAALALVAAWRKLRRRRRVRAGTR